MPLNIPMPSNDRSGLFEGLMQGRQAKLQRDQLSQQQQQFAQQQALREAQEARAQEQFPLQMSGLQTTQDYQKAQADYQREQVEKSRWQRDPQAQSDYFHSLLEGVKGEDGNIDWNDPLTIMALEMARGQSLPQFHPTALQKEARTLAQGDPRLYPQMLANLRHQYHDPQAFEPNQGQSGFEQEGMDQADDQVESQSQMNPAMREMLEVNNHLNNAISMGSYTPGEKVAARKRMNEELPKIQDAKLILNKIDKVNKLIDQNPELYRKAVGIMFDPDRKTDNQGKFTSIRDNLIQAGIPKDQLEAAVTIDKYFTDIVNKMSNTTNQRPTDLFRRMQQRAKASVKNPDMANKRILDSLLYELIPVAAREKALLYSLKHNLDLPYTLNYDQLGAGLFEGLGGEAEGSQSQGESQMLTGEIEGQQVPVHPTQRDDFEKAGGRIL